jgi:hypothetical protein
LGLAFYERVYVMKKPNFKELAQFLDSDSTLEFIPDIVWNIESQVHSLKLKWLEERLERAWTAWQLELTKQPVEDTADAE